MVEEIYKMKNEILQQAKKELAERGPDRIDVNRMGELVDMVKDLAEAEKSCMEARYYGEVTNAMKGSSGYQGNQMGYDSMRSGYAAGSGGTGSSAGYGSMRQGYGSMGHQEIMEPLREKLRNSTPDEREHLRNEVLTMIGAM